MVKHINLSQKRGAAKDKALSPEEREILLNKIIKSHHRIILMLGGFGGLRVEEICQCRFSWLERTKLKDKEVLRIKIPAEDRDARNKLKLWRPKTRKARTAYIFENDILNEIYFWFQNNPGGLKISRQAIHDIVKKHFCRIIGRKEFCTHALRSTAQNYLLYEKDFKPKFVAIVLGHADMRTTIKHYNSMNQASAESYLMGVFNHN